MRVTILGCGHSSGTPQIALGWGNCDPGNPKNRRLRPSILVENDDTRILVDTSPDMRQQLLTADVNHLDAVFYTHAHADHLHGIDDLRAINRSMERSIEAYADAATWEHIDNRFPYALQPLPEGTNFYYKPTLNPHVITDGGAFRVGTIEVTAFEQEHGHCQTRGFRFGPIAYSTDVLELPDYAFDILAGVETWIVGTLVDSPHPAHAHVDKALEWIERVRPKRAVLTHLSSDLDYETLRKRLPQGVEPAYDGMLIEA
jgi:phosphoribosyl 1,2-cyclic phosphate phosphodiesterase